MPVLAGERIFTVAGTSYAWEDLVLAGCLWGDWAALEARVQAGLACLARLDDLEEGDEDALDEADVEAAAAAGVLSSSRVLEIRFFVALTPFTSEISAAPH